MNIGNTLRDAIGQVAPTVAAALGGPLAGNVARHVSEAVLGRPDAPEQLLRDAVQNLGPEQVAALERLEAEYTARLRIAAEDRADARQRQITTGDRFPMYFSMAIGFAFFASLLVLCFVEPPAGAESIVYAMTGTLGAAFMGAVQYYFGSSIGSKSKERIMAGRGL